MIYFYIVCKLCGQFRQESSVSIILQERSLRKRLKCRHIDWIASIALGKWIDKGDYPEIIVNVQEFIKFMYLHIDKKGKWHIKVLPEGNRNDTLAKEIVCENL